jgi:hypothetical protein
VARDAETLLRAARDELYHQRVITNSLRNRLKTDAAALADGERRTQALIAEIESALNGSPRPEGGTGTYEQDILTPHGQ